MATPQEYVHYVSENEPRLSAYAFTIIGNWLEADQVVRECLLVVRHIWDRGASDLEIWRCLRAIAIARIRRKPGRPRVRSSSALMARPPAVAGLGATGLGGTGFMELPLRDREAVALVFGLGFTEKSAGEILGIDESSVHNHLLRASQRANDLIRSVGSEGMNGGAGDDLP